MSDGPNTQVLVWRYGARKGMSIPPEVDEQLHLGYELREHLVDLVHARERAIAGVWANHAEVAAAQEAAERAQARLDELLERAAQERERSRRRTIPVELREQIAHARLVRREAKTMAREAKDRVYATVAPALHEARAIERQARKAAYGEFVLRRGLYWATFNNVARKHALADRRICHSASRAAERSCDTTGTTEPAGSQFSLSASSTNPSGQPSCCAHPRARGGHAETATGGSGEPGGVDRAIAS